MISMVPYIALGSCYGIVLETTHDVKDRPMVPVNFPPYLTMLDVFASSICGFETFRQPFPAPKRVVNRHLLWRKGIAALTMMHNYRYWC